MSCCLWQPLLTMLDLYSKMIPFPDYEPDKSIFDPSGATVVTNVEPVEGGWGPIANHVPVATALPTGVKGAIATLDSSGTYSIFCGTTTKLYKYNSGTLSFDDVSTAATTYDVPDGYNWSFHQWGDLLLATNQTDGLYKFDLTSGTEFVNISSAPLARAVTNVGEFVVLLYIDGSPRRVQWSEIGDVDSWTVGLNGSDFQDFPDGGDIRAAQPGEGGAVILQQRAIRKMDYVGGDYTFAFSQLSTARGSVSNLSSVVANNGIFFLDEDGFYYLSNQGPEPIGAEKVNRTFLEDIDLDYIAEVQGSADPVNKMVWWVYRKVDTTRGILGYDWQLKRWTTMDKNYNYLFSASIPAYTLEALDTISASIDALGVSLDSRIWTGGRPTFAAFDSNNEFGFFSGNPMDVVVETTDQVLGNEGGRAFVNGYRFVTDAATHTGKVGTKDTHAGTRSWSTEGTPDNDTALIPCRENARLHRFRAIIPQDEPWNHIHGVEAKVRDGGRR